MSFLFDFFPAILFFAAFMYFDIYVASGVLILSALIQNIVHWIMYKKVNNMHLATLIITGVLGGITIILRDPFFIKIKPSIVYLGFAIALFLVPLFKEKNLIEIMMSKQFELPKSIWKKLNYSWIIFFLTMALLNIYIAFYYNLDLDEEARMNSWVFFKVWITLALTFLFTIAQMFFLYKYIDEDSIKKTKEIKASNHKNQE